MPPSGTSRSPGRGGRTSQFAPAIHVVQSVRGSRAGAGSGVQATRNSPNTALPRSPVGTTSTAAATARSEEHTSELQSLAYLVCRLLLEKKKKKRSTSQRPTTNRLASVHIHVSVVS